MLFLIEDVPDIRDSLREILEGEGYEVHVAANGQEALEALETLPSPGLILLDLLMPVMNGTEFLRAQERHPRLAAIPVVVLSADAKKAAPAGPGVRCHVRKPIDLDELLQVVKGAEA